MAQITVSYKDFNEMIEVAKELIKSLDKEPAPMQEKEVPAAVQPVPQASAQIQTVPVPAAPVPDTLPPVQTTVPTSKTAYQIDDLAKAAMTLMDAGRQAELQQLLSVFGVTSLPELPSEQYGSFATALREKGAPI